jgi:hypothetical protein
MKKLKTLVLTALAAATLGVGALASAPSASAMSVNCDAPLLREAWRSGQVSWRLRR